MFEKILVANRGEIACRVMRTAKKMGIATVAVYSDADARAPHGIMADEAMCLGPPPAGESYLKAELILDAAEPAGADAIQPGYGILSERESFARACAEVGITFIGPPPNAIAAMGDKIGSKKLAKAAGVNVVPGFVGEIRDTEHAVEIAVGIGDPVMMKASAGGGGKGMRLAFSVKDLREGFEATKRKGLAGFGDDRLFIEKFIESPRTSKSRSWAISTATSSISAKVNARSSGATRRWWRRRRPPSSARRCGARWVSRRSPLPPRWAITAPAR